MLKTRRPLKKVQMRGGEREFTGDLPARTMVGTGLIVPDGLVEIMPTAVK